MLVPVHKDTGKKLSKAEVKKQQDDEAAEEQRKLAQAKKNAEGKGA